MVLETIIYKSRVTYKTPLTTRGHTSSCFCWNQRSFMISAVRAKCRGKRIVGRRCNYGRMGQKGRAAVVQLSKRMISAISIALVWTLSMSAAQAGPWNYGPSVREGSRQESYPGQRGGRQSDDRRQSYQREEGRDARRAQRMSPEERQQLRRDIRDAGREVYSPRR